LSLSQARTLGRAGSILVFIPVLNIIGYILLLISIGGVARSVQDRSIFSNAVIAIVLQVVGVLVGFFMIFGGVAASVMTAGLSAVVGVLSGLAVIWVCFVIAAFFLRRSYRSMASRLGVPDFGTAGMLFLVGSALLILLGLGLFVIFVAYIFQAMAFFSIRGEPGT